MHQLRLNHLETPCRTKLLTSRTPFTPAHLCVFGEGFPRDRPEFPICCELRFLVLDELGKSMRPTWREIRRQSSSRLPIHTAPRPGTWPIILVVRPRLIPSRRLSEPMSMQSSSAPRQIHMSA